MDESREADCAGGHRWAGDGEPAEIDIESLNDEQLRQLSDAALARWAARRADGLAGDAASLAKQGAHLDRVLSRAALAAAGELQTLAAEVGVGKVRESDLTRALQRALQAQLGAFVRRELALPPHDAWPGRLGGADVAIVNDAGAGYAFIEAKWTTDKLDEALWDLLKMGLVSTLPGVDATYLVYVSSRSGWSQKANRPVDLFDEREHTIASLLEAHRAGWKRILAGNRSARPLALPGLLATRVITGVPIHVFDAEPWEVRAVGVSAPGRQLLRFDPEGWPTRSPGVA